MSKYIQATRIGQATPAQSLYLSAGILGTALGAYHGYARNRSLGWAIAWGLLGGAFPIFTIPVAIAQGFGQPARR